MERPLSQMATGAKLLSISVTHRMAQCVDWDDCSADFDSSSECFDFHWALRALGAKVIKMDATIYVGMLVSMGKIDADIFTGDKIWDVAPQSLAVTEAGGKATTLDGAEITPEETINGLVISNGHLHDQILGIIKASEGE